MSSSLTQLRELEETLMHEPDPGKRRAVLHGLYGAPVPDNSIINTVVEVLDDPDPTVAAEAAAVLLKWERKGVWAVMTALRGTSADRVERRQILIRLLGRFGTQAAVAETLLRTFEKEEELATEVRDALARIRNDWGILFGGLTEWGIEVLVLFAAVAMPALGIVAVYRPANQPFPWMPTLLGIAGGVGAILLARAACSSMFDPRQTDERARKIRRYLTTAGLAAAGLLFGVFIGNVALAGKAAAEKVVPGK